VCAPNMFHSYLFLSYTETPDIYTLPLHDALPICQHQHGDVAAHLHRGIEGRLVVDHERGHGLLAQRGFDRIGDEVGVVAAALDRSEEHTSELQSRENLVCRLLLEKKKTSTIIIKT